MTAHGADAFTWFTYDLPKKLAVGTKTAEFLYGTGRERYKQIQKAGATSNATIYYVGTLFEKEIAGAPATHRRSAARSGAANSATARCRRLAVRIDQ